MGEAQLAYKERRKQPFLEAYVLHGSVASAARAVGISRFAVFDWKKNDPAFAAACTRAHALHRQLKVQVHNDCKTILSRIGMGTGGKAALNAAGSSGGGTAIHAGLGKPVERREWRSVFV